VSNKAGRRKYFLIPIIYLLRRFNTTEVDNIDEPREHDQLMQVVISMVDS